MRVGETLLHLGCCSPYTTLRTESPSIFLDPRSGKIEATLLAGYLYTDVVLFFFSSFAVNVPFPFPLLRFRFRFHYSVPVSGFRIPDSLFLCCRELKTKIETNKSEILFKKEIKIH